MITIMDCKPYEDLCTTNFANDSSIIINNSTTFVKEEQQEEKISYYTDFKEDTSDFDIDEPKNSTDYVEVEDIEKLLIKPECESDLEEIEENYELSPSDIEKEFEKFNTEDEKINSGKTILENNSTVYRCQICNEVFKVFAEYRSHKKQHFIEKRT